MRLLIDTNVLFDVYERRQPAYAASNHILKLARRGRVTAAIASHTVANCFYYYGKNVIPFLREDVLDCLDVAAGDAHQVKVGLNLGMSDLEDAMQVAAALAWKAAFILTGNARDFRKSAVPAITPAEWIKRFEPALLQ